MQLDNTEEVLAFCYIQKDQDNRNLCYLTPQHLKVIYKGRLHFFELDRIQHIDFNFRRTMIPLLFGGVAVPFSLIAIFYHHIHSMLILSIFLCGLFSFYYGWNGKNVFTIHESGRRCDFAVARPTANLKAFFSFINHYLGQAQKHTTSKENLIYHITQASDWEKSKTSQHYSAPSLNSEGFIHASSYQQILHTANKFFKGQQNLLLLGIDPLKLSCQVIYEPGVDDGLLYPHIYGSINKEAVRLILPISYTSEGEFYIPGL
jgi:uncharacterized protein (DUF952 family)